MGQSREELQSIINEARRKLGDIEYREAKERVAPLDGKCFRYRNNYSVPQKPSDYWWLYVKIIGTKGASAVTFEFQTDKYGKLSIEPHQQHYNRFPSDDRGYQPISAAEFKRAWQAVQKRVAGWKP